MPFSVRMKWLLPVTVVALSGVACGGERPSPILLVVEADTAAAFAGTWTIEGAEQAAVSVSRQVSVDGFGHVADVVGFDSGFAVLDRMAKRAIVYDFNGARLMEFGRDGKGPGELSDPLAIAFAGRKWIIWDLATRSFNVYDREGAFVQMIRGPEFGDWAPHISRRGLTRWDYPFQAPDENLADHLVPTFDDAFLHLLYQRPPTLTDAESYVSIGTVVRYNLDGHLDTLVELNGTPLVKRPRNPQLSGDRFQSRLLAGRPLLATGRGWLAFGHGDSTRITIEFAEGGSLVVTLPEPAQRVTESDRVLLAEAILRHQAEVTNAVGRIGAGEVERMIDLQKEAFASEVAYTEYLPRASALLGSGRCLWINVPEATSVYFGQSRYWIGLDVYGLQLVGVARMPKNELVRAFDGEHVYTSTVREASEPTVMVYKLPQLWKC